MRVKAGLQADFVTWCEFHSKVNVYDKKIFVGLTLQRQILWDCLFLNLKLQS
ncbi:hypothetical protein MUDAN_MDHGFNIF_02651 [Lactiplantibacillus mudanjiangensis]|uniref:Uncharacterized protein n=1 Tax=Lactiplantibacillus mudanjiangensis TaxID=1296538 RepID=A0A660DXR2_9LACO|nr:hypothetical protein MUDAN_IGPPGNFN_02222 [Lactiplantibacillus mudanjiangensis]VDG27827.1 hypothetical protein MUDAN_MDHGFNIF_02651 [Lactiplantibacillus mudanjiangensis]